MNSSGAKLITKSIGGIITEDIGLKKSTLTENQRKSWESDSKQYHILIEKKN